MAKRRSKRAKRSKPEKRREADYLDGFSLGLDARTRPLLTIIRDTPRERLGELLKVMRRWHQQTMEGRDNG